MSYLLYKRTNVVTLIITRSDTETDKKWWCKKVILGCDKSGKRTDTDSGTQNVTKKFGCPFKIRLTPGKMGLDGRLM